MIRYFVPHHKDVVIERERSHDLVVTPDGTYFGYELAACLYVIERANNAIDRAEDALAIARQRYLDALSNFDMMPDPD